jgi:hypothetical protein
MAIETVKKVEGLAEKNRKRKLKGETRKRTGNRLERKREFY